MRTIWVLALAAIGCSYPDVDFGANSGDAATDSTTGDGSGSETMSDTFAPGVDTLSETTTRDAGDGAPIDAVVDTGPRCGTSGCGPCPADMVEVAAPGKTFCIDIYEVTNAQYRAYLLGTPPVIAQPKACAWNTDFQPGGVWPPAAGTAAWPVTSVDWCDAWLYCRAAGKRLCGKVGGGAVPSAQSGLADYDEFTRACSNGGFRIYPYGDSFVPSACNGKEYGANHPVDVGSLVGCKSVAGAYDQNGNAGEWEDSCDPSGDVDAGAAWDLCLFRGGDYAGNSVSLNCTHNYVSHRDSKVEIIGFRCCAD